MNKLKVLINTKITYAVIVIISIIVMTFSFTINEKMHESNKGGNPGIMSLYLGVAISNIKYDETGYVGYDYIFKILNDNRIIDNKVIAKTFSTKNTSNDLKYTMQSYDLGFIDYCRIAFYLFGNQIESLLYFYIAIFCFSIVLFITVFRKFPLAIFVLMLYLISHYVAIITITNVAGDNPRVIYNPRLIPMLGILPLIHLCLSFYHNSRGKYAFIAIFFQSLIILMAYHIRSTVLWLILFVISLILFDAFSYLYKSHYKMVGLNLFITIKKIFNKILFVKYWVFAPLLTLFFAYKIIFPLFLDPIYSEKGEGIHSFWGTIVNGLALHPDIRRDYVGEREFTFDVNKNNYYKYMVDCADVIHNDNIVKGIIRKAICERPELIAHLSKFKFYFNQIVTYEANDQDCYSAGFNWLRNNGMSEFQFFNFDSTEFVNYNKHFTWFKKNKSIELTNISEFEIGAQREFLFRRDFNIGEFEKIQKNIVLNVVKTYPLKVLELTIFIKPLQYMFMYANSFFLKILDFIPVVMFCFVLLIISTVNNISNIEIRNFLIFFSLMFLFSFSPYMITYPGRHVMFDQVIIIHILEYLLLIVFLRYTSKLFVNNKMITYVNKLKKGLTLLRGVSR